MPLRPHLLPVLLLPSVGCFDPTGVTPPAPGVETSTSTGSVADADPSSAAEVDHDGEASGTGDEASPVESSTDADPSTGSTAGPIGPHCGDGNLDDDETCDDGDAIDGNGCNADCEPSGRLLWCHTDGDFDEDAGQGITVDNEGNVFATGYLFRAGEDEDVWVGGWTPDGTELFVVHLDPSSGGYDRGRDIVYAAGADQLWVLGAENDGAWLYRVSLAGELVDDDLLAVPDASAVIPRAMVVGPTSVYWVGSAQPSNVWEPLVGRLSVFGGEIWTVHSPQGPAASASATSVAIDSLGNVVIGGHSMPEGFVRRAAAGDGDLELSIGALPPVAGIAVAANGDIVLAGTHVVNGHGTDIVVQRRSSDAAEVVWSTDLNGDANLDDNARAVALDANDNVVVAGELRVSNEEVHAVVARLDDDGEVMWSTAVDRQGDYTGIADLALDAAGSASVVGTVAGDAGDGEILVCRFAP